MIMIQIHSSELFLREKGKNCVNSDQYTEYFEDIWGSKVGIIEIPGIYNTSLDGRLPFTDSVLTLLKWVERHMAVR